MNTENILVDGKELQRGEHAWDFAGLSDGQIALRMIDDQLLEHE